MDSIYIIRRLGLVDHEPTYLRLLESNNTEWQWVHHMTNGKIFRLPEDAFVVLNKVKNNGGVGIDYCVMEIEINEKRVDITTKSCQ